MTSYIGNWIYDLRKNGNISQENLCRGLISNSELSRFENGEKDLPYTVVEALLQRLGLSCDKFEIQMGASEYECFILRQTVFHSIGISADKFERLCKAFEQKSDMSQPLEKQYLLIMQAAALYIQEQDVRECLCLLDKALSCTWSSDTLDMSNQLFCTQELQILLLQIYCLIEIDDNEAAQNRLNSVEKYLKLHISDEEEYARLYPQLCYLNATNAIKTENHVRACGYIKEGKRCISDNGLFSLVNEFLNLEITYGEKKDNARKEYEAFLYVDKLLENENDKSVFLKFISLNQHRSIILTNEMIRDTRKHEKITQEDLAWDICATETLSRIEGGKRTPQRSKLDLLYERLGVDQGTFQSFITESCEVYFLDRDYKRYRFRGEYEKAMHLFYKICELLDDSIAINRQYIQFNIILENIRKQTIDYPVAIDRLKDIMSITMPDFDGHLFRVPSRNEFFILINIAACYRKVNDFKAAESVYNELYRIMITSKVSDEHHAREMMVLYSNYSGVLEDNGKLIEAESIATQGLRMMKRCGRGDMIAIQMANLARTYQRLGAGKKDITSVECFKASHHIAKMYGNKSLVESLERNHPDIQFD